MRKSPSRPAPHYGLEAVDVVVPDDNAGPLQVTLRRTDLDRVGEEVLVRVRFAIGCDDARRAGRQSIGHQLTDGFDAVPEVGSRLPRVCIAGGTCHTHNPKGRSGHERSMHDAFNFGWRLTACLDGQVRPELLDMCSAKGQAVAKQLIDFDHE